MASNSFYLLSEEMQNAVWKMKWDYLYPIQEKAIAAIIQSNNHVILAAETAGGKTEAAFLPILSLVANQAPKNLKVLYISPLKALINDQFRRIGDLCELCDVKIFRWHGDVSRGHKNKLIKNPQGILQITPESLESLFINRTSYLKELFRELDFIVIDEVHSFWGNERGIQLRSLLHRILSYSKKPVRLVALSATIADKSYAKKWINPVNPDQVDMIESNNFEKPLKYCVMHFLRDKSLKVPLDLFEDMRKLTTSLSSIIFCNSRGQVEETCHILSRLAGKEGDKNVYYPHHASLSAVEREYVEDKVKKSLYPVSVVSTSTLELGIDIGAIDMVIQLDSTFTVSSLKQRLGRSGRKPGSSRIFQLYSTTEESLLQSLAVTELLLSNWLEPPQEQKLPYDILFHQILSMVVEKDGILKSDLFSKIQGNPAFFHMPLEKIELLIEHMASKDYLEKIRPNEEYILGLEGERILRSKEFYSVFVTPEEYEVRAKDRIIGSLSKLPYYQPGLNIILAGKLWTIKKIDYNRSIVYVEKAVSAKPPIYSGSGGKINHEIRSKMVEILCTQKKYPYLFGDGAQLLDALRKEANIMGLTQPEDRLLIDKGSWYEFLAFAGDVEAYTLAIMIRKNNVVRQANLQ